VGHWVYTDDGWTWVSEGDEVAWGETCYHYGRWFDDPDYGWAWVPGTVWSPAWVAWREGDGYSAWAPLPPECGDGVVVTPDVADAYCRPEDYVVVDERFLTEPSVGRHVEVNNTAIFNRTVNITKISYADNRAVNRGVDVAHVQQRIGRPVPVVHAQRATSAAEARKLVAEGKPVMYVPPAVETHIKAHPIQTRNAPAAKEIIAHRQTMPRRQPGHPAPKAQEIKRQPAGHERPDVKPQPRERTEVKPQPRAHEEVKPQPREREEVKPQPREREEVKPQPREREEVKPQPRAHEETKPPVKKPEERRPEEKKRPDEKEKEK
jgi:hypothetical protein